MPWLEFEYSAVAFFLFSVIPERRRSLFPGNDFDFAKENDSRRK